MDLETGENPHLNDGNQQAVFDAIQQLSADMASMKRDLAWLETSKKQRKHHDSSDDSMVNMSKEECMESSDDSHGKGNPTPSLDTRIKSLIASEEQVSTAAPTEPGSLLGKIALDLKKSKYKLAKPSTMSLPPLWMLYWQKSFLMLNYRRKWISIPAATMSTG